MTQIHQLSQKVGDISEAFHLLQRHGTDHEILLTLVPVFRAAADELETALESEA